MRFQLLHRIIFQSILILVLFIIYTNTIHPSVSTSHYQPNHPPFLSKSHSHHLPTFLTQIKYISHNTNSSIPYISSSPTWPPQTVPPPIKKSRLCTLLYSCRHLVSSIRIVKHFCQSSYGNDTSLLTIPPHPLSLRTDV